MARRDTDTRPVPSRPSIPGRGRRGGCRCAPPAPSASRFSCRLARVTRAPLYQQGLGARHHAFELVRSRMGRGAREGASTSMTCAATHALRAPTSTGARCALNDDLAAVVGAHSPDGIDAPARKSTSATEAPRRRRRYRSTRSAISPGLRAPKITRSVPLTCPRSSTAHPDPIADTRHLTPTPAQSRTPLPRGAGRASYHGW